MQITNLYKAGQEIEAFTGRFTVAVLSDKVKMRLFRMEAGQKQDTLEIHKGVDESLIILSGVIVVHTLNGEFTLNAGDSAFIEHDTYHKLEALEEAIGMVTRVMN